MKWEKIALSELVEFSPKISLEKGEFYDHIPMEAINSGIKFPREFYQKEYTGGGTKFANGDTLFARITPCLENGKIAKVKDLEKEVGFGSTEYFVLRAKENISNSDFVYYLAITDLVRNTAIKSMSGADGRQRADKGVVEQLSVFNIPLPTQRKIASILSAYDDLIENNLKRIKLLEEKAYLMYKSMQKDLADAGKTNLYDFADIQMGFAFKAEAFNEVGEGIPIIRIRDIPNQITKSYTTQEVENQYWVEKGDLLIGMDGDFHMNEWLGQRGYLVQRVCRLRTKNVLNQSYLWQALKEPIHYYQTTISGATVAHLGKKHLEEIFIYQPKASMKNELEELNTMRKLKIVLANQNTKLREARDILLPKLMNGQIEV